MQYNGISGSNGIAIAKVLYYKREKMVIDKSTITEDKATEEMAKVDASVEASKEQINQIMQQAAKDFNEEEAAIFDAHLMILEDPELLKSIKETIESKKIRASYAASQIIDKYVDTFNCMEDEYFKERAADIKDVGDRLIRNIIGIKDQSIGDLSDDVIVVAHDLTPSDTALMDKKHVKGFALNIGGRTAHTAIMARSLEIPAVLGLGNITDKVKNDDTIIVDGNSGTVIVNCDRDTLLKYKEKIEKYNKYKEELKNIAGLPAVTLDGRSIEVAGNIGSPGEADSVIKYGGDGIGLFRTEFLYMDRNNFPSEDEQYKAYAEAAEKMQGKPVIIRTLDIGGDKVLPYLPMQEEINPFLGWRAIRICFDLKDMFKTQLRAILRASVHKNVRIMYPMISSVDEVIAANEILDEAKSELRDKGVPFDEDIQCGVMIEIPSAAITADLIIKEVDFFSIGTNDLCQYTLAVDRMNQKISSLYQPYHPGVLRLIKSVADTAHQNNKFVGMCGELAGEPAAALLLAGMGLDELSMSASSMLQIKKIIMNITMQEAEKAAEHALSLGTSKQIQSYLESELKRINVMDLED